MRKQTSRIISMILSLAMLAAFVLAPLPVANAAATKTIYFDNSGYGWSAVYVYSWNGSGDCTGGWPGSAMTKVDGSIYSYEVPADAVNIIFTDNSGNQTLRCSFLISRTSIKLPATEKSFYIFKLQCCI